MSVFFAPAKYRVVKIMCSYSEVVLWTIKNYKAHYSLSWFRPLLQGNSPMSNIFCYIRRWTVLHWGELRAREVHKVNGGNVLVSTCLKGRGPFIATRHLGFTWPVGPDLRWSVPQGQLEASTVFGTVLESSRLSPSLWGQVSSWCLVLVVISSHVGWWGGWASLYPTPAYGS
jgi:hypothetical protein